MDRLCQTYLHIIPKTLAKNCVLFFLLLLVYFFVFGDKAAKAVRPVCDLCVLLLPQSSGYLSYITVSLCFILLWRNGNAELFFFLGIK